MNKILLTISVLGVLAGCSSVDENFKDDGSFKQCTEIVRNKRHIVYECPKGEKGVFWVNETLKKSPDSKFRSLSGIKDIENAVTDEKTLVEVVKEKGKCKHHDHYYRVMVTNHLDAYYAKQSCGVVYLQDILNQ